MRKKSAFPPGQSPASIRTAERLMRALAEAPMDQHDVSSFLQFSPSGGRKYARMLVDSGVASMVVIGKTRQRLYRVTDLALGQAWIARLYAAALPRAGDTPQRASRASARNLPEGLHLMQDDAPFAIKRPTGGPARRDPLVAALFGPAGAAEPPDPPVEPPERPVGPTLPTPRSTP